MEAAEMLSENEKAGGERTVALPHSNLTFKKQSKSSS